MSWLENVNFLISHLHLGLKSLLLCPLKVVMKYTQNCLLSVLLNNNNNNVNLYGAVTWALPKTRASNKVMGKKLGPSETWVST